MGGSPPSGFTDYIWEILCMKVKRTTSCIRRKRCIKAWSWGLQGACFCLILLLRYHIYFAATKSAAWKSKYKSRGDAATAILREKEEPSATQSRPPQISISMLEESLIISKQGYAQLIYPSGCWHTCMSMGHKPCI